ncbi:head GIN domain-containing protein [Sphingobacterium sp. SYP-B4668]|uniref:head GIN domain-containing protein n=1 Tax=Sphingobacterium sp. SYP-B4668 TaxID=2996035 RepID=UPI0022DD3D7D|nr:head GIN domain-containing protein [Sphingobacterium sp. SYP-B4668]
MRKIIIICLLSVFAVKLSAQMSQVVSPFTTVEATDKINVQLKYSKDLKVTIEGALAKDVEVIQKNGILRLKMNTRNILQGDKVDVIVYGQDVSRIISKKGARIVAAESGILSEDLIKLTAADGGLIDLHKLSVQEINADVNKGGNIRLEGKVTSQEIQLTFGGIYDAKNLTSEQAKATVNGGGRCEIKALKSVDTQVRAGGVIDVYGNPPQTKEKKLAGGIVNYK